MKISAVTTPSRIERPEQIQRTLTKSPSHVVGLMLRGYEDRVGIITSVKAIGLGIASHDQAQFAPVVLSHLLVGLRDERFGTAPFDESTNGTVPQAPQRTKSFNEFAPSEHPAHSCHCEMC